MRRLDDLPLRAKIVLILSAVVLAYGVLDGVVQRCVVYDSFVRLEAREAGRDVLRVREAIQNEVRHLESRSGDWATSSQTRTFVTGADPEAAHASLDEHTLSRDKLDLLVLCRPDGTVLWNRATSGCEDPDPHAIEFHDFPNESLALSHPLLMRLAQEPLGQPASGLLETEHGHLLVCARRMLAQSESGAELGLVVIGRLLTPAWQAALVRQTGVSFTLVPVLDALEREPDRETFDAATSSDEPIVRTVDARSLRAIARMTDISEAPAILIQTSGPRAISASGASALRYALFSTVAAGLLMMLALLFLLTRTVLKPLARLTAHAVEIGRSEELTRKLELARKDEIGILSGEFDSMMEKLAQSRAQVVRAARAAGMSEIATGVLHNVGNVLNSVNVSTSLLAQNAMRSGAGDLKRVVEAIRGSTGDLASFVAKDPRGAHLDPLLEQIAEQLVSESAERERELGSLARGIDHIKELIHAQQGIAGRAGVLEQVDPRELVRSAVKLTASSSMGEKPEVLEEFQDVGLVPLDRHRLMEVLVNVVQNARQALSSAGLERRRLVVRIASDKPEELRIEVEDSGPGIAPENLTRIFTHGFTTRAEGHGFGLHACANAATEMGGTLTADSRGLGHGARFIVSLPIKRAHAAALRGELS
ncbi:MAG: HAMP domain-containing protein [Planctomycetes bacterium]|nr:HAMP domain-containing protein [Planctomycetota bacterium]